MLAVPDIPMAGQVKDYDLKAKSKLLETPNVWAQQENLGMADIDLKGSMQPAALMHPNILQGSTRCVTEKVRQHNILSSLDPGSNDYRVYCFVLVVVVCLCWSFSLSSFVHCHFT